MVRCIGPDDIGADNDEVEADRPLDTDVLSVYMTPVAVADDPAAGADTDVGSCVPAPPIRPKPQTLDCAFTLPAWLLDSALPLPSGLATSCSLPSVLVYGREGRRDPFADVDDEVGGGVDICCGDTTTLPSAR